MKYIQQDKRKRPYQKFNRKPSGTCTPIPSIKRINKQLVINIQSILEKQVVRARRQRKHRKEDKI